MKDSLVYGGLVIFIIVIKTSVSSCPTEGCPAGTHCVDESSLCKRCVGNRFQSQQNSFAYACDDCSPSCGQREVIVKNCTIYNDLICQCEKGYHREGVENGVCVPHNACKAGFEEVEQGNHANDTLCAPCKTGMYRSDESTSKTCLKCSECSDNKDEIASCTPSQDTQCQPKTDPVVIGVIVGVAVLVVLAGLIVCICLHRKGYLNLLFWKREKEKRPLDSEYHLANNQAAESPVTPTKVLRNGTSRNPSGESNGQARVKLESVSSTGSGAGGRSRMHSGSTSPTEISADFQSLILKVSEDLCSIPEWKMFMRSLIGDGSDIYINSAVNDNPNNTQEQIYQVFRKWIRKNPDLASRQFVVDELKYFGLNSIAIKYEDGVTTDV